MWYRIRSGHSGHCCPARYRCTAPGAPASQPSLSFSYPTLLAWQAGASLQPWELTMVSFCADQAYLVVWRGVLRYEPPVPPDEVEVEASHAVARQLAPQVAAAPREVESGVLVQ